MTWCLGSRIAKLLIAACFATAALADENGLLMQLRANLAEKPTAVRESLLPGLYGVYFNSAEPRTFVDGKFTILGNQATGYSYLTGPRRGQDLPSQEVSRLFAQILAAIPRERLPTYRFGNGRREVFLFTAYDCPSCRALEGELTKRAKALDATVYIIPTALGYSTDPSAKTALRGVLCASNRQEAWSALMLKRAAAAPSADCMENPDDYVFLSRSFPVRFPLSVPTAVTTDGRIYPMVLAKFDEVFRGR